MTGDSSTPPVKGTAAMVAERAGVSTATVSLVANGNYQGRVSADRVMRVRKAIRELNYVVDRVASSLVKGSSNLIIFLTSDIANPYFGHVITGIQESLGQAYKLLVAVVPPDIEHRAADVQELFGFRPAGLLVTGPSALFLSDMAVDRPTVVLDSPNVIGLTPSVNFDISFGSEALADHLAELGHRKVAYLDADTDASTFSLRRKFFYDKARLHGISEPTFNDARSPISLEAAASTFHDSWVAWRRSGVTAVVCATDTHAYGVLQETQNLGLDVPGQLAVAGFDDLPYSTVCHPNLTSVALPGQTLGRVAAAKLLTLLQGEEVRMAPILGSHLVIRASTMGTNSR